jgi:hypothetical protein
MARQISQQPFMVTTLVGMNMIGIINAQLEELLAQPDMPNLYWTLTAMPDPLIDIVPSLEYETHIVYLLVPEMEPSKRRALSPAQWEALAPQVLGTLVKARQTFAGKRELTAAERAKPVEELLKSAPAAKADLIAAGHPQAEVEAMGPGQAVLLDIFEIYDAYQSELLQWQSLPYWQAAPGLEAAEKRLAASSKSQDLVSLIQDLRSPLAVGYSSRAYRSLLMAALRCVEAVRLYAATHDGKLPARLEDIREVPIPINPMTGQAFGYRLEGDVAVLEAQAAVHYSLRQYRLTIAK